MFVSSFSPPSTIHSDWLPIPRLNTGQLAFFSISILEWSFRLCLSGSFHIVFPLFLAPTPSQPFRKTSPVSPSHSLDHRRASTSHGIARPSWKDAPLALSQLLYSVFSRICLPPLLLFVCFLVLFLLCFLTHSACAFLHLRLLTVASLACRLRCRSGGGLRDAKCHLTRRRKDSCEASLGSRIPSFCMYRPGQLRFLYWKSQGARCESSSQA